MTVHEAAELQGLNATSEGVVPRQMSESVAAKATCGCALPDNHLRNRSVGIAWLRAGKPVGADVSPAEERAEHGRFEGRNDARGFGSACFSACTANRRLA
jgi:hypothetical protein